MCEVDSLCLPERRLATKRAGRAQVPPRPSTKDTQQARTRKADVSCQLLYARCCCHCCRCCRRCCSRQCAFKYLPSLPGRLCGEPLSSCSRCCTFVFPKGVTCVRGTTSKTFVRCIFFSSLLPHHFRASTLCCACLTD